MYVYGFDVAGKKDIRPERCRLHIEIGFVGKHFTGRSEPYRKPCTNRLHNYYEI